MKNCITIQNFNAVFERIIIRPSRTILNRENHRWEMICDHDGYKILFMKDDTLVGEINSNILTRAFGRNMDKEVKLIKEINLIFCDLYAWSQGDTSIGIDW